MWLARSEGALKRAWFERFGQDFIGNSHIEILRVARLRVLDHRKAAYDEVANFMLVENSQQIFEV
jgi:hypothetical protein